MLRSDDNPKGNTLGSFLRKAEKCNSSVQQETKIRKLMSHIQHIEAENRQLRLRLMHESKSSERMVELLVADKMARQLRGLSARVVNGIRYLERMADDFRSIQTDLQTFYGEAIACGALRPGTASSEMSAELLMKKHRQVLSDVPESPMNSSEFWELDQVDREESMEADVEEKSDANPTDKNNSPTPSPVSTPSVQSGRARRKAAPVCLKEPKLNVKMRRTSQSK